MADNFSADFSEVERLVVNMGRVSAQVVTAAAGVVAKGALNIKNDTRKNVSDNPSWKRLASTVNYDIKGLSAVIGYDDNKQGELAGIYEFGSAHRAPHPTLYPAAAREVPNFEKALGAVAAKITQAIL
jgi:hypothetical protein